MAEATASFCFCRCCARRWSVRAQTPGDTFHLRDTCVILSRDSSKQGRDTCRGFLLDQKPRWAPCCCDHAALHSYGLTLPAV